MKASDDMLRRLSKMIDGKPGVILADVYHDSWCMIYAGGQCDCNPDVKMVRVERKGGEQ